jgi:phenylpyruvate tautomerase PptA (4-oxalocrotonate tautomerase family)
MTWPEWSRKRLISLSLCGNPTFATEDRAEIFCRTQDRGLMPAMVSGFNCSHALPFNIDKRTRGGRQALRASGGCVPGRRIPAQQAGELRNGEIAPGQRLAFAGSEEPAAFLELRSIGLPDAKRGSLCTELTDLIAEFCGIARDRIFLVMVDVDAKLWGHDGKTFG